MANSKIKCPDCGGDTVKVSGGGLKMKTRVVFVVRKCKACGNMFRHYIQEKQPKASEQVRERYRCTLTEDCAVSKTCDYICDAGRCATFRAVVLRKMKTNV